MRRIWFGSIGLWLAANATPALGDELRWTPAPRAQQRQAEVAPAAPAAPAGPRVKLGRPRVKLGRPEVVAAGASAPVVRGQDPGSTPLGAPSRLGSPQVSESRNGKAVAPVPFGTGTASRVPAPLPGVMTAMPTPAPMVTPMPGTVISETPVMPYEVPGVVGGGCATGACGSPFDGGVVMGEGFAGGEPWAGAEAGGLSDDVLITSFEYLSWLAKGADVPPLATLSPVSSFGIVGQPGTTVVGGASDLLDDRRDGFRLRGAWFCDPCRLWGIDGGIFVTDTVSSSYAFSNNPFSTADGPNALLARPFRTPNFGGLFGGNFSEVVASAGSLRGGINVDADSNLWGAEINGRRKLLRDCNWNVDFLIGYRYLSLKDTINITENITGLPQDPNFAGTSVIVNDRFRTTNHFHGGQLGLTGNWALGGRWGLDWRASVALGTVRQTLEVAGSQNVLSPGTGAFAGFFRQGVTPGGLLALDSNGGTFNRDRFAVLPEVGVNLTYNLTQRLKLFGGYNFMYLSNVVRAADQIDTTLDINRVPQFPVPNFAGGGVLPPGGAPPAGVVRPQPLFRDTDFWAQGLNFGLQFNW